MRLLSSCVSALAICAASAHGIFAQQIRPYRPDFDVQDYAITIDLPDTGSTIHVNDVITVQRPGKADTLVLDLLDLHVNSVSVDGNAVRFVQTPTNVEVPLPKKRGTHPSYRVAVDYGGAVTDGLIVRTDSAGRWTYFGDNFPDRARHWIASIDHPSDKATVSWRVRAPAGRTVVANGKLVAKRNVRDAAGDERVEWQWRESRPISVYLMVIAAAPLEVYDLGDTACGLADRQRCVPQMVYTAPEQHASMPGAFARAPEIVEFFARLVGPFPYEKLAHLQSSTRFGGMENASDIFYSDRAFRRGTMNDDLIAHETSHQWFGDAVTEREWSNLWLSEGFATYFAALWTRAARGDSAFLADMSHIRTTVLRDTIAVTKRPVIDTLEHDYMALLNRNSYEKGGFVLQMLRAQVGEGAFFDALREYYMAHRNSTALTSDLEAAMEHQSKQKLGWFFDQWLRRPGYPELTAKWTYDAAAHEVVVDLTQSDRFGAFQFPVSVAVVDSAGGTHRATAEMPAVAGEARQLRIPSATAPAHVIVDPDVQLLAAITVLGQ
jgi:aminopeptidase N